MLKLIGMLDSPYVRRTAISMESLGIAFEHEAVSVFSTFEKFQSINPVVKAPSLVCGDGIVLMDSSLILQYAESIATAGRSLMPRDADTLRQVLCILGIALAACEKAVQLVYERNLRPAEFQYQPWIIRVTGQLRAACAALEREVNGGAKLLFSGDLNQAAITTAVTWRFVQMMLPEVILVAEHPALVEFSAKLEPLAEFMKYPPLGPGVSMEKAERK